MDDIETNELETILYECERCAYITNNKHTLIRHLKKKIECPCTNSSRTRAEILKKFEKVYDDTAVSCSWCDKQFTHKNNLYAHRKTCRSKPVEAQEVHTSTTENTNAATSGTSSTQVTNEMTFNVLQEILKELKSKQMGNNIVYNTNIQNNLNININSFGNESLEHLKADVLTKLVNDRDIVEFVRRIHFDPDAPENHNVKRITTSKDYYKNQFLATYGENGKWDHKEKNVVLKSVIMKGLKAMSDYSKEQWQNIKLTDEEYFKLNGWILDTTCNTKQFMKQCFALTLDKNFLLEEP